MERNTRTKSEKEYVSAIIQNLSHMFGRVNRENAGMTKKREDWLSRFSLVRICRLVRRRQYHQRVW
jgi:hypothetical protein